MCACADVLNFKYRNFKIFLLKLGSELQNFIKKFQPVLKYKQNADRISTKWNEQRLFPQFIGNCQKFDIRPNLQRLPTKNKILIFCLL